jgi:hypothetical protein
MGFDYFYGFMGGETDQWQPWLFQNTTQIFPWLGHPGYNLITDMADEAIKYLNCSGASLRSHFQWVLPSRNRTELPLLLEASVPSRRRRPRTRRLTTNQTSSGYAAAFFICYCVAFHKGS